MKYEQFWEGCGGNHSEKGFMELFSGVTKFQEWVK